MLKLHILRLIFITCIMDYKHGYSATLSWKIPESNKAPSFLVVKQIYTVF